MTRGKTAPLLLGLLLAALFLTLLYLPGFKGSWLVDDTPNVGVFLDFTPETAPYYNIITGNNSGPLGRPVAMASFALNHVAGLFSPYALKATNFGIHLGNALLLFLLLYNIFRVRSPAAGISPLLLAAMLAFWWSLLPFHSSAVLYIVQRMTLLASFFSLLVLLSYVAGRRCLAAGALRSGSALLLASLLLFFPLGVLSKESAFSVLPWLVLLELFLFQPKAQKYLPGIVLGLVLATIASAFFLVIIFGLQGDYLGRDFSLSERLLSEARAVCSYAVSTFLPNNASMGVFNDDYAISTGLFTPWTTAPAVAAIVALVLAGIALARPATWLMALGLLLFLSGHLLESSVVPLELYFEHRNYLPALGLLLAATQLALAAPLSRKNLAIVTALYLAVLAFSTYQRNQVWGDNNALLATSAVNHPHSVRAWTDYTENLVSQGKGGEALQADSMAAQANPELASIFYLQMISIYCRSNQTPPQALIDATSASLGMLPANRPSTFISISTGLDFILTQYREKQCGDPDFSALAPGLLQLDRNLSAHFGDQRGGQWKLRLFMAEWLLAVARPQDAIPLLQDTWDHWQRGEIPMIGLTLAKALHQAGEQTRLQQVLDQLERVADNPPPDFQAEMASLRSGHQE